MDTVLDEHMPVRDEEGDFRSEFLRAVEAALETEDIAGVRGLTADLHEGDLADLLELLKPEQRDQLIRMLGHEFNPAALSELDEGVRDQILATLPAEVVADVLQQLDTDDAVYLLEDLAEEDRNAILDQLPRLDQLTLKKSLEFPEDSAGRIMRTEVISVPPFWSVGQTIDFMRESDDLPERFDEIFVVDPAFHLIGSVALNKLLRSKRQVNIADITDHELRPIQADADQEDVAREFERYNLSSAPVVDDDNRLIGVITADDVVEVVQEEAEEDILHLAGVSGASSISGSVWHTARQRFAGLIFNLFTALLASYVISFFDATIDQMVVLAVLMPIVASMGGNAATQTMAVTVRALATRDLGRVNALRVIGRECTVGLLNGLLFAVLMGTIVYLWFGRTDLGFIIASAMVINLFVAALAGILIPLGMNELRLDPAITSGVFVTMVTDVVGFFAFLGLAALWLL